MIKIENRLAYPNCQEKVCNQKTTQFKNHNVGVDRKNIVGN